MTIVTFEEYTFELTQVEKHVLVPFLIRLFSDTKQPVKAPDIVRETNLYLKGHNVGLQMTEPRLRKCCNHIRTNSLLPLIATSKGYFVSHDREVIERQIKSLNQRASSIRDCATGLQKILQGGRGDREVT